MNPGGTGRLREESLTRSVIGSFYEVHRELGFGFREYIYALALERLLKAKGHSVQREVPVTVYFQREPLAAQSIDMIVDAKLMVESKATEWLHPRAMSQAFSYLAATDLELALVLHYGHEPRFHRVIFENHLKHRTRRA